jgi:hypothetical protein
MKNYYFTIILISLFFYGFKGVSQPVAVNDYFSPVITPGITIYFNLVQNDINPGTPVRIDEVFTEGNDVPFTAFNDTSIWIHFGNITSEYVLKYRLCKINNPAVVSNWAYAHINPTLNIHYPVAVNDTVEMSPGDTIYLDVLSNDYDPEADPIYLDSAFYLVSDHAPAVAPEIAGNMVRLVLSLTDYLIFNDGSFSYRYTISGILPVNSVTGDQGLLYVKVQNVDCYDYLDINNIKARFSCFGNHFWDMEGKSHFNYPNGTEKTALFNSSVWLGGKAFGNDTILHIAAETYRKDGGDFWPGPISGSYDSEYDQKWFRVWKLSKDELDYHYTHWWYPNYTPIENILTWPGNGDTILGQAQKLAPFFDNDNDGIYEPLEGDCPYIRGDQAIYFIFNDARGDHYETGGMKLGIEVQGMAYAFDAPQNPALWNTVFLHYDIINRSDTTYYETYLGNFTDGDIGSARDDYVGCNVEGGYYYFYNGDAIDGSGESYAYGGPNPPPPAAAVKIMGGPLMDPDNIDNPAGECDEGINGLNFGDSIIDNERLGMTGFIYFNNCHGGSMCDPDNANEFYNYLLCNWLDSTSLIYGGTGHSDVPDTGLIECEFMLPGNTDSCGWGTGGVPQSSWSEANKNNPVGDRRGLGISGPFIFFPGQTLSVDYAYIMAFSDSSINSALDTLGNYSDIITGLFENNSPIFNGTGKEVFNLPQLKIYPNPATDIVFIYADNLPSCKYSLFDITGKFQKSGNINPGKFNQFSIAGLAKGVYSLRITGKEVNMTFIIVKI